MGAICFVSRWRGALAAAALISGLAILLYPQGSVEGRYPLAPASAGLDASAERAEAVKHSRQPAKQSLATFKAIWQSEHKNDQVSSTEWSLDDPFPVTVVGSDELKRAERGEEKLENVFSLSPREIIYPVSADHGFVGAMTLRKASSGDWLVSAYGGKGLPERLVQLRRKETKGKETKGTEFWAVSVTPLDHYFLACKKDKDLRLIAISDNPSLGWKSEQSVPAESLYRSLIKGLTESSRWNAD